VSGSDPNPLRGTCSAAVVLPAALPHEVKSPWALWGASPTPSGVHHQYNTELCDFKTLRAPLPGQREETAMAPLQTF
jgi:hypothetical protein